MAGFRRDGHNYGILLSIDDLISGQAYKISAIVLDPSHSSQIPVIVHDAHF